MERREERENLMKLFYQMDIAGDDSEKAYTDYVEANMKGKDSGYFHGVYDAFIREKETVDSVIDSCSNKWKTTRMPAVDLSILRVAVTEIKFIDEVPAPVAVNEAVELAKKYSTDKSSGFINGVLGNVVKNNA